MKRLGFVVFALLAALAAQPTATPPEKRASVKEIMARAHKPKGLYFALVKALKDEAPAWDDVQAHAQALSKLAADLPRNAPPRGDAESWQRDAKAYADNAVALEQAAEKKDRKAALAATAAMGEPACSSCHKAHRK
jgi:hypothetical protein